MEGVFNGLLKDATPFKNVANPILLGVGTLVLIGTFLYFLIIPGANVKKVIGMCVIIIIATMSYNMTANRIYTIPLTDNVSIDATNPIVSIVCNYMLMMTRILILCFLLYYVLAIVNVILEASINPLKKYLETVTKPIWPPYILDFSEASTWIIHGSAFGIGLVTVIVAYFVNISTVPSIPSMPSMPTKNTSTSSSTSTSTCTEEDNVDSSTLDQSNQSFDIQNLLVKCILMAFAVVLTFYIIVLYKQMDAVYVSKK